MHRFARLLAAPAGWLPAASAYAHPGSHPHAHPHLDVYAIVLLLVAVAGIVVWAVRHARRSKRPPSE